MRKLFGLTIVFLLSLAQVWAQTKDVTGKITDAKDGSPLPGATVKVKGTTRVTTTAPDGTFKISAINSEVLVFSFVGFKQQSITVGSQSTINVVLATDV